MDDKGFDPKYDDNKKADEIVFTKATAKPNGSTFRKVELLLEPEYTFLSDKVAESLEQPVEFNVEEKVVLYSTRGGQQKIHCWLVESTDGKHVDAVHISRRTEKGTYGTEEITLLPDAVRALKFFLDRLFSTETLDKSKLKIPLTPTENSAKQILSQIEFAQLIKANIKSTDDFYKLLSIQKMELSIAELEDIIKGNYKNEVAIQMFLKENLWMFGNDYAHIVEENKINARNILDIIPKNIESYIDIIEVKLPDEILFRFDESHGNYYCSSNLTKAIAQTQNYIFELERKNTDEIYQDKNGCRIIRPRGIVLYGSSVELDSSQSHYLRILNASYHNMQVITYQQLLNKAKSTLVFSKNTQH